MDKSQRSIDGYTAESGTYAGIDVTPPDAQNGNLDIYGRKPAPGDTYDVTAFKPKRQIAAGSYNRVRCALPGRSAR